MKSARPLSKLFFVFILLIAANSVYAQQANTWIFGNNAGMSFSTSPATPFNGGQTSQPDNTSTISDANGNLLFYTNGINVWTKTHTIMPNGSGLVGHVSAGQCAVIVPVPCSANKYVIFHVTEYASPGYLNYTVVDMSLNSGFGDVVSGQKNVSLGSGWTEKICAYYNASGNNYWVLVHKWNSDQFVAFSVTNNNIAVQSVTTSIGSVHNCGTYSGTHDAMGQLTFSPDGSKVANALTCQDSYELFDFNLTTGLLSNSVSISSDGLKAWGTAFSPNSSVLYVNTLFGNNIYQFNLSSSNPSVIAASKYTVGTESGSGYHFGYMELGPNGKLYIAKPNSYSVSIVNNPNATGSSCNFSMFGQSTGSNLSSHGLSRIAYNIPSGQSTSSLNITVSSNPGSFSVCQGQSLTVSATGANSFSWSTSAVSHSITVAPVSTTIYTVTGSGSCSSNTITTQVVFTVNVNPSPTISVTGNNNICPGNTATLSSNGASSYTWSPGGQTTSLISVSPVASTVFTVSGNNGNGCVGTSTYNLLVAANPVITIAGNNTVCAGQSVNLSAVGANSYTWSTGALNSVLVLIPLSSGTYSVSGSNLNGCLGSASISINVVPMPTIGVNATYSICSGQNATLSATGGSTYLWNSGATNPSIIVSPSNTSIYTVTGTSSGGCAAQATAQVLVMQTPSLSIAGNFTICTRQSTTLSATGASSYSWSNGVFGNINVLSPAVTGTYSLLGTSAQGCQTTSTLTVTVNECLGVKPVNERNFIKIRPNPATDYIQFEALTISDYNIRVFDASGKLILESMVQPEMKVNIAEWPQGLYFIEATNGVQNFHSKFVKN